jgi:hypothetical protein
VRCYVPRTGTILFIIVIGAVALHGPVGHAAATVGIVTAVLAGVALVAGLVTGITLAARARQRRRAVAGGCVSCRFKCQQALTRRGFRPAVRRPFLVGFYTVERAHPQWPHEPMPLSATRSGDAEAAVVEQAAVPDNVVAETLVVPEDILVPGTSLSGAAEDHDRARTDGDLVPT